MKSSKLKTQLLLNLILSIFVASCSKTIDVEVGGMNTTEREHGGLPISAVAIKSYNQLNATFSALTGVPVTYRPPQGQNFNNGDVLNTFNDLRGSLPFTNDLGAFGANSQLAIYKLASVYCNIVARDENIRVASQPTRNILFPGINFASLQNPNNTFSNNAALKQAIVFALINHFWGDGLSAEPESTSEYIALFDELSTGLANNQNNANTTRSILVGMCAAVLSASPVALF